MKRMSVDGLGMNGFVKVNNSIYFPSFCFNGIFKYEFNNHSTSFISYVSDSFYPTPLLGEGTLYGKHIIYPPMHGKDIVVLNVENSTIKKYEIDDKEIGCHAVRFFASIIKDNKAFLIPYMSRSVCVFDLNCNTMKYYSVLNEDMEGKGGKNNPLFWSWHSGNNKIWLTSYNTNIIMSFDMNDFKVDTYELGDKEDRFGRIYEHDEDIFVINRNTNQLIRWNYKKNIYDKLQFPNINIDMYSSIIEKENSLWMASEYFNEIVKIELDSCAMNCYTIKGICEQKRGCLSLINNSICYYPINGKFFYILNTETFEVDGYEIDMDENFSVVYHKKEMENLVKNRDIYGYDNLEILLTSLR